MSINSGDQARPALPGVEKVKYGENRQAGHGDTQQPGKGTLITTGDYGKGAKDATFEMGAAPVTLINGETLIDLLIQHEIGVKKAVEYFELDESAFQADGSEEVDGLIGEAADENMD